MGKAFAIIHTWPDLRNAEYEVLQRIIAAAARIEADAVVIDSHGRILSGGSAIGKANHEILDGSEVDFVVSLHFFSPRVVDCHSYYALWQPIEFYHDFGYSVSVDAFSSHNDLLSCDSDVADTHGLNLLAGLGREVQSPLPRLFHTLPEPFLKPRIGAGSRLFYVGINWERVVAPRGRFHETLSALDAENFIDIYGPELLHGIEPWAGFSGYRGELPFDGVSIKSAINASGVCLALSSIPHKNAGIMSNRLFEGLAGGAAVIASPNALVRKHFSEVVYQVDDSRGDAVLEAQILDALRQIRSDPAEAVRRVLEGQKILRDICSLEGSLRALFEQTPDRKAAFDATCLRDAAVTVVLDARLAEVADIASKIEGLARQKKSSIRLTVVCDQHVSTAHYAAIVGMAGGSVQSVEVRSGRFASRRSTHGIDDRNDRLGPIVRDTLGGLRTPFFALLNMDDTLFSDHFSALAGALERDFKAVFASSGAIRAGHDELGETRVLESLKFQSMTSVVLVSGEARTGRFLFRSSLAEQLPKHLMALLDGEEGAFFALSGMLSGALAQSGYATYIYNDDPDLRFRPTDHPVHQRQYIRDHFASDPRWIDRLAMGRELPRFVYATGPDSPVRWSDASIPDTIPRPMLVDAEYSVTTGGSGVPFLVKGFSPPEPGHSWVAGERGVIEFAAPAGGFSGGDWEFAMTLSGRPSQTTGREQHCTVLLNGKTVAYVLVPSTEALVRVSVPPVLAETHALRIELVPDHAEPVLDPAGRVIDDRTLSLKLVSFRLIDHAPKRPVLAVGEVLRCANSGSWPTAIVSGFYDPEPNLTWVAGRQGVFSFDLDRRQVKPRLVIGLAGRRSNKSGALQVATITVNGYTHAGCEIPDGGAEMTIDVFPDLFENPIMVRCTAAHAEPVIADNQTVVDSRMLGLAIISVTVLDRDGSDDWDPDARVRVAPISR